MLKSIQNLSDCVQTYLKYHVNNTPIAIKKEKEKSTKAAQVVPELIRFAWIQVIGVPYHRFRRYLIEMALLPMNYLNKW